MKIKITPLNYIALISAAIALYFYFKTNNTPPNGDWKNGLSFYFFAIIVPVSLVLNLIFRFIFKDQKRIWITETVLIAIIASLIFFFIQSAK